MIDDMLDAFARPEPPAAREETGFFTDTTLCIGCKACEVACKQWNQLPADGFEWTGNSYDNTSQLSSTTWRHVAFVEQFEGGRNRTSAEGEASIPDLAAGSYKVKVVKAGFTVVGDDPSAAVTPGGATTATVTMAAAK